MVDHLKSTVALVALSACGWLGAAQAGVSVPDPTRPSLPAPAEPTAAPAGDGAALQLQSVLLGKGTGRTPAALISGTLVPLGGQLGEARLVRVSEHAAVLRGPQGQTTLLLIPGVEKLDSAAVDRPLRSAAAPSASVVSAPARSLPPILAEATR